MYLCLCSQWYIVAHVELVDFFWVSVNNLVSNNTSLQHTTNWSQNFLPLDSSGAMSEHWENLINMVYVAIYSCRSQWFSCDDSYACICCDHSLQAAWVDFCVCWSCAETTFLHTEGKNTLGTRLCAYPHAIKSCLLHVYPWRHTHDKLYQALSLLNGERAWEWGYRLASPALPYRMFWGTKTLRVYICGFPAKYTWSGYTCLGEDCYTSARQCEPQ